MDSPRALIQIYDPWVCAGNIRLMYMIADALKAIGFKIKILCSSIRPWRVWHFHPQDLKRYHNLHYVNTPRIEGRGDYEEDEEFLCVDPGEYESFLNYLAYAKFDVTFVNDEVFSYLVPPVWNRSFLYVHWPQLNIRPPLRLLCNSTFTQKHIRRKWRLKAQVLYPSIHFEDYRSEEHKDIDLVVFSALRADKFPSFFLDELKNVNKYKVAAGAMEEESEVECYFDDVIKNPTFDEYVDVLAKTKVYLHLKPVEHFGITIVEAMACGCIPVVYAYGGPWFDIIEEGKWGVGYGVGDLAKAVDKAFTFDRDVRRRALSFSFEKMCRELKCITQSSVLHKSI